MTMLTSVTYALKSTHRNFRRSFTLIFGIIILFTIVSEVLLYLDSTSGELVQADFADVHIDTVIFDPILTENETIALQEFVLSDISDLITSAEIIAGTEPFGPNTVRSIVAADDQYNLSSMENIRTMFSTEGDFATTYIFVIEPSYLDSFSSIFSTTAGIAQIYENDEVLILIMKNLRGDFEKL